MGLPPVFTLQDLRLAGMTAGSAKVAVNGWKRDGFIAAAGPKLGVYYNLIADREGRNAHLGSVLRQQFGSVVIIGPTVLNEAGWTTQVPQALTVAVPFARTFPEVDGAILYPRHPEWFARIQSIARTAERGRYGLHALPASWAFADALKHEDSLHHMAPDDFDIPDDGDCRPMLQAFDVFGLPPDTYASYLEASSVQLPLDLRRMELSVPQGRGCRR